MKTSANNSENSKPRTLWVIANRKGVGYFTGFTGNVLKYADFGRIHNAIIFESYDEADKFRKDIKAITAVAPYSKSRANRW